MTRCVFGGFSIRVSAGSSPVDNKMASDTFKLIHPVLIPSITAGLFMEQAQHGVE
jgi:hypothetical protein